jgi:polygalacturonase
MIRITKKIAKVTCILLFLYTGNAKAQATEVNVKSYGAKGDGVTDDSKAITDAIQAGKTVVFPRRLYLKIVMT